MKSIITEITSYEAIDGSVFKTEIECLRHELWLRLKEKYGTYFKSEERYPYKDYSNNTFLVFSSISAYNRFVELNINKQKYLTNPIEILRDLNLNKFELHPSEEQEYELY